MIPRDEATAAILAAKADKKLTFAEIAKAVGKHTVWVTSALLGQATMIGRGGPEGRRRPRPRARTWRRRSRRTRPRVRSTADVPVDPLIYRFHEITQVYGTTLKALIQEMFGDGIMSAIDFDDGRRRSRKTPRATASSSR